MPKPRAALSPQSVWDAEAVSSAFAAAGVPKVEHHVSRLWGHLIRHSSSSWHDVPDFPQSALATLDASFVKFSSKLNAVKCSKDGETLKLLLQLQGGMQVEAVVMRYDTQCKHSRDSGAASTSGGLRSTLCVSSQVGCQMGCKFCATGVHPSVHFSCSVLKSRFCNPVCQLEALRLKTASERAARDFGRTHDNHGQGFALCLIDFAAVTQSALTWICVIMAAIKKTCLNAVCGWHCPHCDNATHGAV
jgi:hypothetical protein